MEFTNRFRLAFFLCFFGWFGIAPLMPVVREDLGLTQAQIAELSGLSHTSVENSLREAKRWLRFLRSPVSISEASSVSPAANSRRLRGSLSTMERDRIVEVLAQTGGNKLTAARILGLSRRALYRRLERYALDRDAVAKRSRNEKQA